MAVTVEQPQRTDTPPKPAPQATEPTRSWLERYQQHLWIGGVSLLLIAVFSVPIILAPKPAVGLPLASTQPTVSIAPASVSITASEFKFNPPSIQVAVGRKVTLTLQNSGAVEHDVTIPSAGFSLLARAGQTATGDFTFDQPGVWHRARTHAPGS